VFGHKKHEHEPEPKPDHGWTSGTGTVVESRLEHGTWTYVVDYHRSTGGTFRVMVSASPGHNVELVPGTPVQLEKDARSGEVRIAGTPPRGGSPVITVAGQGDRGAAVAAALMGLGQPGAPGVHITGGTEVRIVSGNEVRVTGGAQAAEVMEAVQELMSGGNRAAARERLRHLQADLRTQAAAAAAPAEPEGFSSGGPSTFDSVTQAGPPPTTFSSPDPSVGQPGPVFGQPGFSPVAPATTFSSPASAGSFSAGSSFGAFGETKSDRIARLEDQRDRGQITPEQFAAQRQQIQDEI
jgi:hypothetical protein